MPDGWRRYVASREASNSMARDCWGSREGDEVIGSAVGRISWCLLKCEGMKEGICNTGRFEGRQSEGKYNDAENPHTHTHGALLHIPPNHGIVQAFDSRVLCMGTRTLAL